LALPRGAREVNHINNLAKGLGKNSVIDLQSVSEGRPKPLSQEALLRPDLIVDSGNLPATACAVRDLLALTGQFFDRGTPVKIIRPADGGPPQAIPLSATAVVIEAHRVCRPVRPQGGDDFVPITLPDRVARMYLEMAGEWNLPRLAGITTAPVLEPDGTVRTADGYNSATELWCARVPALQTPEHPKRAEAEGALRLLREIFRTFPFADSPLCFDKAFGVGVVDLGQPPGYDESSFLAGLLTAVCRPSLWLTPGFLGRAPEISGAGTGKGLLVRSISAIAFGIRPRAFTKGGDRQELDKRLASDLIEAAPILFLDNVNGTTLRSDMLASVLTERPTRVRPLGRTRMVAMNCTAFVAVTGNGLGVSEDLARRFVVCELDARCEDPEQRQFGSDFLEEIENRRAELLEAVLTIWRWGRQNAASLKRGRALGSFEQWGEWCRDPLLALGCRDPVERIESVKSDDPHRRQIVALFEAWHRHHGERPVKAAALAEPVRALVDPQGQGRQHVAARLVRLTRTHIGGFVLTREGPAGRWGAATYSLVRARA
jgi:putative DNA primase/helicase